MSGSFDPLAWAGAQLKGSDRVTHLLWATVIGAIIIRSIPGWLYPAWGPDYGIYFGITKDFIDHPQFFRPYSGWGTSYSYFPVLYAVTAAVHGLTGLDLDFLMPKVAPIFGGLTVLVLYLIIKELFKNRAVALASAAFLAANPFQIFQTSHAAPLTMGHFFLCLCILFFVLQRRSRFWTGPLYISTALLIGSHHLTTYFYILFLFTALVIRNLGSREWTEHLKEDIFYFLATVTLTFSYWILIATPVFRADFASALPIGSWTTVGLFYILVAAVFVAIPYIRKWERFQGFVAWKLGWPTPREDAFKIGVSAGICVGFSVLFTFIHIWGSNFILLPAATIFLLPLFFTLGLAVAGYRYLDRFSESAYAKAWLLSILASFMFSVVTRNTAIYSFRHLEYFAYPLSILGGVAVWEIWNYLGKGTGFRVPGSGGRGPGDGRVPSSSRHPAPGTRHPTSMRNAFLAGIAVLIVASASTAYAVQSTTTQFEESISDQVMEAADWMKDNIHTNLTVASDHILSQILWTRGFNTTSDEAYWIFLAPDWRGTLDELNGTNKTCGKVGYVFIDDVMRTKGVMSNLNETPRPITDELYAKYSAEPFELLHRSASSDGSKWAEVYMVNWTYIDNAIG
jgi:4-amino-4-deoxy-L-arabinose transferase-like glycosyltransferase